jgi:hypothetical protein
MFLQNAGIAIILGTLDFKIFLWRLFSPTCLFKYRIRVENTMYRHAEPEEIIIIIVLKVKEYGKSTSHNFNNL